MTTPEERQHIYRKGKYRYFRHPRTKQLTALPHDEASQAFADAYDPLLRALEGTNDPAPAALASPVTRPGAFLPGSIGWFIEQYVASKKFLKLANKTRGGYLGVFDVMKEEIGTAMLHDVTPQGVDVYSAKIARTNSASMADVHTTLLSNLWEFAKGFEEFKRGDRLCPTIGRTRHYEHDGEGHLAWPEDVIDKFDGWAEPHLRRYRMGLQYTGQRGVDVVKMKWSDYDGELINVVQQKTGERIWLHCPDVLRTMLDGMERVSPFIFTNMWKRPYASAASLSNCIALHLEKIGHPEFTMHGLRKNAGMELAMAGCTTSEVMAVLGHRSPKMAIFYVQQADKKRLGRTATIKWNAYVDERRTERVTERTAQVAERRANIKAV